MTIYLAIRSDSRHTRSVLLAAWAAQLADWPDLGAEEPSRGWFDILRDGQARARLRAFACDADGNYAVRDGDPPPSHINLVELWVPHEECAHIDRYDALAVRLARHLGWEAWGQDDDGGDVPLWPARMD